jgi:hypothetical protein
MGEQEGKRPLETPRRMWENNIEMDLKDAVLGSIDSINLSQDRDQGSCECGNEPSCSVTCWEILE